MQPTFTRRTALSIGGTAALMSGSFLKSASARQDAESLTLPNGSELTWRAPWSMTEDASLGENSAIFQDETGAECFVQLLGETGDFNNLIDSIFTRKVEDMSQVRNLAGGSEAWEFEGSQTTVEYRVYRLVQGDYEAGYYFQLTNGTELTALFAETSVFAAAISSAQDSITLNGAALFQNIEGGDIQSGLESPAFRDPKEGSTTIDQGSVFVEWTNDWKVISQHERGIELTNPTESVTVSVLTMPVWEIGTSFVAFWTDQQFREEVAALRLFNNLTEQGEGVTGSPLSITETSYSFATNGQLGYQFIEGFGRSPGGDIYDPALLYITEVVARDFGGGDSQVLPLLEEVKAAVRVDGNELFSSLDEAVADFVSQ